MQLLDLFVTIMVLMGVISAAFVAFHPNVLYAAVALVFSLLSVAGLYAALGADFLAGAQLIIYVGGIIIVILFAVMMSENIYRSRFLDGAKKFILPFITSFAFLFALVNLIHNTEWPRNAEIDRSLETTVQSLGLALVGPYALVFQYVAIVLLSGLIGAVVVARPHHDDHQGPQGKKG